MADTMGRRLLERAGPPEGWPASAPVRAVIVEGEPDFLTWATRFSDADEAPPAVFGLTSGGWSPAIASRVPTGATVIIRTHQDPAGAKYAEVVFHTLHGRCAVLREAESEVPNEA